MNTSNKKAALSGASFSAKIILAILIAAPLVVVFQVPEWIALLIGALLAFVPNFVFKLLLGISKGGLYLGNMVLDVTQSALQAVWRVVEAAGSKLLEVIRKKNRHG